MSLYSLYSNLMTHVLICQCSKVVCKGSGNQVIVDESPRLSDFFGCQITLRKPLIYVSFHCRVGESYAECLLCFLGNLLQMSLFRQGKTTKDIHDLLRLVEP